MDIIKEKLGFKMHYLAKRASNICILYLRKVDKNNIGAPKMQNIFGALSNCEFSSIRLFSIAINMVITTLR